MDCIIEKAPDIEMAVRIKGMPLQVDEKKTDATFYNQVRDELTNLATTSQPVRNDVITYPGTSKATDEGATLSVYRVSDTSPITFLAHCIGVAGPEKNIVSALPWHHTLIGILND